MLNTHLPGNVKWVHQLRPILEGAKVTQVQIVAKLDWSMPTIIKILNRDWPHDQLSDIEQALMDRK